MAVMVFPRAMFQASADAPKPAEAGAEVWVPNYSYHRSTVCWEKTRKKMGNWSRWRLIMNLIDQRLNLIGAIGDALNLIELFWSTNWIYSATSDRQWCLIARWLGLKKIHRESFPPGHLNCHPTTLKYHCIQRLNQSNWQSTLMTSQKSQSNSEFGTSINFNLNPPTNSDKNSHWKFAFKNSRNSQKVTQKRQAPAAPAAPAPSEPSAAEKPTIEAPADFAEDDVTAVGPGGAGVPAGPGSGDQWKSMEKPLVISHNWENHRKSPLFMGKFSWTMVTFHSYVKLPEGKWRSKHSLFPRINSLCNHGYENNNARMGSSGYRHIWTGLDFRLMINNY